MKECRYKGMYEKTSPIRKLQHIVTKYFGTIPQSHCKLV